MPERDVVEGLANRLKACREAAGLSQLEAAKRCGVHHVSINRFEKDRHTPTLAILYKLAEAYGVNVCDLLPGGEASVKESEPKKPTAKKPATKKRGKK